MQKALVLEKAGEPLVVKDTAIPKPDAGELLVKVHSVALNPVDWKIQKGMPFGIDFPVILGQDIAGDVQDVGQGVTSFRKGDRVFFQNRFGQTGGGFQQYVISSAATTAIIPSNVSYDEAATIPLVLSTAYVGLYNKSPYGLGIAPPSQIVGSFAGLPFIILGGSSSVGQMAIQLAKLSGFSPVIATASSAHTDCLKALGATNVIDRHLSWEALSAQVSDILNGKDIKYAFDCVGEQSTQQTGLSLLSPGGQLATVRPPLVAAPPNKDVVRVLGQLWAPENVQLLEDLYQNRATKYLESGVIKPNRVEVLNGGLSAIPDGLARLEANRVSMVKLVVHPQETA